MFCMCSTHKLQHSFRPGERMHTVLYEDTLITYLVSGYPKRSGFDEI